MQKSAPIEAQVTKIGKFLERGNLRSPTSMYKIHQNISMKLSFLSTRVTTSSGKVLRLISVADVSEIELVKSPCSKSPWLKVLCSNNFLFIY